MLRFIFTLIMNYIRNILQTFGLYTPKRFERKGTTSTKPLDPMSIQKFKNQLVIPPVYEPIVIKSLFRRRVKKHVYFVDISEFEQQILPDGFPKTVVWGYGGLIKDPKTGRKVYFRNAPGATFEAVRGIPVSVKWTNRLTGSHLFAVDPTLHWANPNNMSMEPSKPWPLFPSGFPEAQKPVPIVTHLHGGENPSAYDGHPDAWFTANGKKGPAFVTSWYNYPNRQESATLWYHDHTLGITRLNVHAGLAGFYLLRDTCHKLDNVETTTLPTGKYEIPLAIQDRSFNEDGSLAYDSSGINPDIHPFWIPEFFGNTIMVNGKVWPNLDVERRQYRFRILNGSNARFFNLKFSNGKSFIQIGSDGGFLPSPVPMDSLLIAPGERADILVDFSDVLPGTSIILQNDANAPFPSGEPVDLETVGQIMQFTVPLNAGLPIIPKEIPLVLNRLPRLIPNAPSRILTLNEVIGPNGPIELLLNGQRWNSPVSELPQVGSTEEWVIVNLTADTHPIHLHLVQFQIQNRQKFDVDKYNEDWVKLNGMPPLNNPTLSLPVEPYLINEPLSPLRNEIGWKDTIQANPGEITRIRVRFAPQDAPASSVQPGTNLYHFDPSKGPGYVWHCHILEHEDNEMMRPYKVKY